MTLTRALLALIPTGGQPLSIDAHLDGRILGFTVAITCATGIIFGLVPAIRASRPDPWTTLKDTVGSIAGAGGSLFLRKGLVAAQVALSFLLLFGAGLFVRSLQNLRTTDTGVALDNLVTFQLAPTLSGYDTPRTVHLYDELLDRLRSSPGIKSAALASVPILSGDEWDNSTAVEGHKAADGEDMPELPNSALAVLAPPQQAGDRARRGDWALMQESRKPLGEVVRGELLLELVVDHQAP